MVLAGPSPLGFTRYYNSIILSAPRGMLGSHWRSNLDRSLITIAVNEPVFNNYPVTGTNTGCSPLWQCTGANRSPAPDLGSPRLFQVGTDPTAYKVLISTAEGNAYAFVWSGGGWQAQDSDVTGKLSYTVDSGNHVLGWTYVNPQDETETYSVAGQLLSVTKRNGTQLNLVYGAPASANTVGQLNTVTDSFGHQLQLSYGSNGLLSALIDPNGGHWTYSYDAVDNLSAVTGPDNKTRNYLYENTSFPNALTGVVDENATRIDTTGYDSYGRAISTVGWNGTDSTTFIYSMDNSSSSQTTALGDNIYRTYTTVLGVPKLYQLSDSASGGTITNNYDANGNLQSSTDFKGNVTSYSYDSVYQLEVARLRPYYTTSTLWDGTYRLPRQFSEGTENTRRITNFSYDSHGNLLSKSVVDVTTNQTQTWNWTYNSYGQVLTATSPRTDVSATTTYTYYTSGNLHTVSNPLGQVTTFSNYNGSGFPQTIVDANGLTTTLSYDARNRLLSQSVGSETTSYQYDNAGQLTLVTLPTGSSVTYVHDPAHRLTEIHDLAGDKIIYTLDAAGNHLSETITDANGLSSLLKHIEQGLAHARLFAAR